MAGVTPALVHDWDLSLEEARELQERLSGRVEETDRLGEVQVVAGVDVSYDRKSPLVCAAVVLMDATSGRVVETASVGAPVSFPYVPGLFSFREIPPLLEVLRRLRRTPDLLLCDGQGRAHPRRFGLACHLGVILDLPSVGCAKSRLVGTHREPGRRRGAHAPLRDRGEIVGEVVRTREGVQPVYVSVGHRVSLETARSWVLRLASRYRLPEPIRAADALAGQARREMLGPELKP